MPFFAMPHMQMYYEVQGHGQPLVLIPGVTLDNSYWRYIMPSLTNEFKVITLDLRDVGQSTCEVNDYSIDDMADDVAELLSYLDLGPYNIAGFSMGGMISHSLARRHVPLVKSLLLLGFGLSTSGRTGWLLRTWVDMAEYLPAELGIREALLWMHADDFFKSGTAVQERVKFVASQPVVQTLDQFRRQAAACGRFKHQIGVTCPTMILIGSDDKLFSQHEAQLLAETIPGAQLRLIDRAGHQIVLEQKDACAAAISEFCLVPAEAGAPKTS